MNNVIDTLIKRKSVRVFLDQEIEEEKVETILKASINAPTAGNQQLYTILKILIHLLNNSYQYFVTINPLLLQLSYCLSILRIVINGMKPIKI